MHASDIIPLLVMYYLYLQILYFFMLICAFWCCFVLKKHCGAENTKTTRIGLVIRDCDPKTIQLFEVGIKKDIFTFPVFCCPPENTNNGVNTFVKNFKSYLYDTCENSNTQDNWWQKIEKFGLFLPLQFVRLYHLTDRKFYQQRLYLHHFKTLLTKETLNIGKIKDEFFPFGKYFECYSLLLKQGDPKRNDILIATAQSTVNPLLKMFIVYVLLSFGCVDDISWSTSEYMYVLDNVCNDRNLVVLKDIGHCINYLEVKKAKLTRYDFLHECQSLATLIIHYKNSLLRKKYISTTTMDKMDLFITCIAKFSHSLFLQGIPVEFCDGGYARMDNKFINDVFIGDNNREKIPAVSIAGPTLSGKSTLLQGLFGIDVRATAGRTTKGINCCKVETIDKRLMVIDTEGIGSGEKDEKRDKKILLAALASCQIFVLNIMRDAANVGILDKILWAYNKLDLKTMNNKNQNKNKNKNSTSCNNGKQLSDIQFIFVIRDCPEYTNDKWLQAQKNDINKQLTTSLGAMKSDITSITDLIGEPIYFAMPSAFDAFGAPNVYFSQRCVELRQIILGEIEKSGLHDNNSCHNQDWCYQMTNVWDYIVRFENVLLAQNLQKQAQMQTMKKAVNDAVSKIRSKMKPKIKMIGQQLLYPNSNNNNHYNNDSDVKDGKDTLGDESNGTSIRMNVKAVEFSAKLTRLLADEMKKTQQIMKENHQYIDKDILDQYCDELESDIMSYRTETIEIFKSTVRNPIWRQLDLTVQTLKDNDLGFNDKKDLMKKLYNIVFDGIKMEFSGKTQMKHDIRHPIEALTQTKQIYNDMNNININSVGIANSTRGKNTNEKKNNEKKENEYYENILLTNNFDFNNFDKNLVFLFGYGSLLFKPSREKTSCYLNDNLAIPVRISNTRRGWIYDTFPHHHDINKRYTAVGIQVTDDDTSHTNGVLFELNTNNVQQLTQELLKFDKRETFYTRVLLDPFENTNIDILTNLSTDINIDKEYFLTKKLQGYNILIYTYVLSPSKQLKWNSFDENRLLSQNYIDICVLGAFQVGGEQFVEQFLDSTFGWVENKLDHGNDNENINGIALGGYVNDRYKLTGLSFKSVSCIDEMDRILIDRFLRRFGYSKYYFQDSNIRSKYTKGQIFGIVNGKQDEILSFKHYFCREMHLTTSCRTRFYVPNEYVSWFIDWPQYQPTILTKSIYNIDDNMYGIDIQDPSPDSQNYESLVLSKFNSIGKYNTQTGATITIDRTSFLGSYDIVDGLPRYCTYCTKANKKKTKKKIIFFLFCFLYLVFSLYFVRNPIGRTGAAGRGSLSRWGPNLEIYVIFTKWHESQLFVGLKYDANMNQHGLVGRDVSSLMLNQLNNKDENRKQYTYRNDNQWYLEEGTNLVLDTIFNGGMHGNDDNDDNIDNDDNDDYRYLCQNKNIIYADILDDTLNTDNAWIEAVVIECHLAQKSKNKDIMVGVQGKIQWFQVESAIQLKTLRKSLEEVILMAEERNKAN